MSQGYLVAGFTGSEIIRRPEDCCLDAFKVLDTYDMRRAA
jgi:hypothetical protein